MSETGYVILIVALFVVGIIAVIGAYNHGHDAGWKGGRDAGYLLGQRAGRRETTFRLCGCFDAVTAIQAQVGAEHAESTRIDLANAGSRL